MQDIHTLGGVGGGGGGRIFSGGVDRRIQPQNLPNHPALKCPRCDSQNTKFCYYNNYNLSQPRHFCKNCRRYWTKGGVLRNVPIGGGCRKSKRSSKGKSSSSNSQPPTDSSNKNEQSENNSHNSHSSSESSSLTATTTAAKNTDAAVGPGTGTASSSNDDFDHYHLLSEQCRGADIAQMGKMVPIVNMVSPSDNPGEWSKDSEKLMNSELIDQHHGVQVDPTALDQQMRERNSGVSTLDWGNVGTLGDVDVTTDTTGVNVGNVGGGAGEHGLFDFTGVDEAYWNQAQWVDDNDQAFNFLPQFQVLDFNLEKK